MLDKLHQPTVLQGVQEAPDVGVEHPVHPSGLDRHRQRVQRIVLAERGVRVATPEDLIVLKLIADRPKDEVDLIGFVRLPAVDWTYVEHWASEWGAADRLARLRQQAG